MFVEVSGKFRAVGGLPAFILHLILTALVLLCLGYSLPSVSYYSAGARPDASPGTKPAPTPRQKRRRDYVSPRLPGYPLA